MASLNFQQNKKVEDAKLARDFQTVLQEFQKIQQLASERESTYSPSVPPSSAPPSTTYNLQFCLLVDQVVLFCHFSSSNAGVFLISETPLARVTLWGLRTSRFLWSRRGKCLILTPFCSEFFAASVGF